MTGTDRRIKRRLYNTLAGIASVVVAVVYVISLGINPKPINDNQSIRLPTNTPDKVATELEVYQFNQDGLLSHILTASKAEYFYLEKPAKPDQYRPTANTGMSIATTSSEEFEIESTEFEESDAETSPVQSNDNYIQLTDPTVVFYRPNESAIRGHATAGEIFPSSNTVKLAGDVMVSDSNTESFLYSDSLSIDTLQKQVFTHDPVKLLSPQSLTTAKGLHGNLMQERWQFLGEVRSTINPR